MKNITCRRDEATVEPQIITSPAIVRDVYPQEEYSVEYGVECVDKGATGPPFGGFSTIHPPRMP